MSSPIDDLKERLEKIKLFGAGSGEDWVTFCDDAYALAEAYREIAVHKCFLGVAQPIGDELIKKCTPLFYSQIDTTAQQILKTSREG